MGKKKSQPTRVVVMSSGRRFAKRNPLAFVAAVVLLLGTAGVSVFMIFNQATSDDDDTDKPKTTAQVIENTDKLKYSNDYKQATSQAASAFDSTSNAEQKYTLALQTASIYETKKDYDNAIDWYLKADELKPNLRGSLTGLGRCYEAKGDKQKAIEYYQKVVALKDSTGEGVQNDKAFYQYRIDQLKGSP